MSATPSALAFRCQTTSLSFFNPIARAGEKLKLTRGCPIHSCYAARGNGLWIHRRVKVDTADVQAAYVGCVKRTSPPG